MNNNLDFQLGMYEPDTDSIIVNVDENSVLIIRCKECNFSVTFDDPNDVVYLYHALHISAIFNQNDGDTIFNFTLYFSKLKIYRITFRQKIISLICSAKSLKNLYNISLVVI